MATAQIYIELAQASQGDFFANASMVNIPAVSATVEDLNRIMSRQFSADAGAQQEVAEPDPAFGTHIKEAADIVKGWLGEREK
jgi:hypothetical protein